MGLDFNRCGSPCPALIDSDPVEIWVMVWVILSPKDYADWLDSDNTNTDGLLAMLKPTDPDSLAMHAVSRQVNSPRNDGPELLKTLASTHR
jgi:putative SOS response-associated peptidase YedK